MTMTSGGARSKSGPPPDPNALRRNRSDDAEWIILPIGGFAGEVPTFPLPNVLEAEEWYWDELWAKPQAFMWDRLGMKFQIASYARTYLESVEPGASATLKNSVLRMEELLGLSVTGMNSLRWKFSVDEVALKRERAERVKPTAKSARERMSALDNG
jgi:hypothetical protein